MIEKDPQAKKVYSMEKAELSGHYMGKMTLREIRSISNKLCKEYRVPKVQIYVRSYDSSHEVVWGIYYPDFMKIALHPKVGKCLLILLHELAHHIAMIKHPYAQQHGPTWMGIYAGLVNKMNLVPLCGMRAICKRHGIRIRLS